MALLDNVEAAYRLTPDMLKHGYQQLGHLSGGCVLNGHTSSLQILYLIALRSIHLRGPAFGACYRHLVKRDLNEMSALIAVMRKPGATSGRVYAGEPAR